LVLFEDTCLLNNPLHFSESQLNYIITKYQNLLHQNNFYIKDNLELILQKDISLKEYLQKIDIPNFRDHIQVLSEYHKEFLFFDEWYHGFIKKNANKMKLFESHVYESDELYYKKIELDCQNYYAQVSSYNLDNFFSLMTKKNQAIKEAIIEIKNKKNDFIKKEKIIFRQSIIYRKQFLQNLFHDTEKLFSDEKKAQYREKIDKINALFNIYNEKLADNEDKISEVDGEINNLIQELRAASFI
jgi:phosphoribosyl-dephospho-CoA transferase